MDDINKPTSAVTDISSETLDKLASQDHDIRNSGVIDIFEQHLPQIPKDYVFKPRDRKFVEDALHAAFDLTGGVPRLVKYAHENYGDYIKLFARLLPEAQKQESGPASLAAACATQWRLDYIDGSLARNSRFLASRMRWPS